MDNEVLEHIKKNNIKIRCRTDSRLINLAFDGSVYVIDADAKAYADELADDIKTITGGKINIERGSIGPVITAHAGPGTIGIIYMSK